MLPAQQLQILGNIQNLPYQNQVGICNMVCLHQGIYLSLIHILPYWAEQMGLIGRRCAQNGVEGRYTAQKCAKLYALFANCRLWLDQNGNLGLLLTWLASQTALL